MLTKRNVNNVRENSLIRKTYFKQWIVTTLENDHCKGEQNKPVQMKTSVGLDFFQNYDLFFLGRGSSNKSVSRFESDKVRDACILVSEARPTSSLVS